MTFRENIDALDSEESEVLANKLREIRDSTIKSLSWRYERNARETRLGLTTTDNIADLDAYAQALADVPQQTGFPKVVEWPLLGNETIDYNNIDYTQWWKYLGQQ